MNNPVSPLLPASVLKAEGVSKTFNDGALNVEVLRKVDLHVKPSERIAIVGASGSGKSTLLHLLGGLERPTTGKVTVSGKEMSHLSENEKSFFRNQYLGFIYQFHHLLPEFTVLENACMPLLLRKTLPKEAIEKAQTLLTRAGLSKRLHHKLGELSGGERQRTAIVRALVTDPICVLADEPTGNLDERTASQVYELMLELNAFLGTSFVIVTHDLRLAAKMQRILVLENGVLHEKN